MCGCLQTEEQQCMTSGIGSASHLYMLHILLIIIMSVYVSGHQTKALLNNSGPKAKRSKLERDINAEVISQLVILIVISLMGAIGELE